MSILCGALGVEKASISITVNTIDLTSPGLAFATAVLKAIAYPYVGVSSIWGWADGEGFSLELRLLIEAPRKTSHISRQRTNRSTAVPGNTSDLSL